MSITLYAGDGCIFTRKVKLAAAICRVKLNQKKPEEYPKDATIFQNCPAAETSYGFIPGSNSVLRYLANQYAAQTELYGASHHDRAHVDSMLDGISSKIEAQILNAGKGSKEAKDELTTVFTTINAALEKNTFLIGHRMTIADLAAASAALVCHERNYIPIDQFVHLVRLVNTVMGRCGFTERITPKESNDKAPAAAAAPAKKAPAAGKDDENDEKPAKQVDPLSLLPPSNFDLDAWKRKYSNTKDLRGDAAPYLWQEFDKDGYSFWKVKYIRYDDKDNVESFKASNLLSMFLQRIENGLRKHMFGVFNIFEEAGYYDIEGVMILRGQSIPLMLEEHAQYDSFTWTKLDPVKDKNTIEDYFCEDEKIQGRVIANCKVYK